LNPLKKTLLFITIMIFFFKIEKTHL
jgi:hypothetical protein